jgi:transposase
MVKIGEDRSERLDCIPATYQVIVTIRPKYACPNGRTGVVQAKGKRPPTTLGLAA